MVWLQWIGPAVIAALAALAVALWQHGGHLSAQRRRLEQELAILEKVPSDSPEKAEYEQYVRERLRQYVAWARRPLWTFAWDPTFRIGLMTATMATFAIAVSFAAPSGVLVVLGVLLAASLVYGFVLHVVWAGRRARDSLIDGGAPKRTSRRPDAAVE